MVKAAPNTKLFMFFLMVEVFFSNDFGSKTLKRSANIGKAVFKYELSSYSIV